MKKIYFILGLAGFAFQGMAQTFVSTEVQNRNPVLEEYTGLNCVYCPDGHKIAQEIKEDIPGTVLINVHAGAFAAPGAGQPDFTTDFGEELATEFKVTGYPSGVLNRTTGAINRGDWEDEAEDIADEESPVNVAIQTSMDFEKRELTVVAEVYYTDDADETSNWLSVGLLQSNIPGHQTGSTNFNPDNVLDNGEYNHQHMLRDMISNKWGDKISETTMGSFFTKTYTYSVPDDVKDVRVFTQFLEVFAFVSEEKDEEILTGVSQYVEVPEEMQGDLSMDNSALEPNSPDLCATDVAASIEVTNESDMTVTDFKIAVTFNGNEYIEEFKGSLAEGQSTTIEWDLPLSGGTYTAEIGLPYEINSGAILDMDVTNSLKERVSGMSFLENAISGDWVAGLDGFVPFHTGIDYSQNAASNVYTTSRSIGANNTRGAAYLLLGANRNVAGLPVDFVFGQVDMSSYSTEPSLAYYYAYADDGTGGTAPNIDIEVSEDCGQSWKFVDGINAKVTGTKPTQGDYFPNSGDYRYNSVSLKDFAGKEVIVRLRATPGTGGSILWIDEITLGDNIVGVSEINNNDLSVYPNPFSDVINVQLDLTNNAEVAINVYDALGRVVSSVSAKEYAAGPHNVTVNTGSLENGVYVVRLESNNEVLNQEVMIKK